MVRLQMPDDIGGIYRFDAICRPDAPPGPAAAWLLDRFVAGAAKPESRPGPADV